jgi:predicted nucleic acid-binding protein
MSDRLFLLDTNVVLTLVRGETLAAHIDSTFGLRDSKVRPLVSIVTHGEVRVLARRNGWGERKLAALRDALDSLVAVDVSHPASA